MEGYAGYKKTHYMICISGKCRRVYEKNGMFWYRADSHWHLTYREYCYVWEV